MLIQFKIFNNFLKNLFEIKITLVIEIIQEW